MVTKICFYFSFKKIKIDALKKTKSLILMIKGGIIEATMAMPTGGNALTICDILKQSLSSMLNLLPMYINVQLEGQKIRFKIFQPNFDEYDGMLTN